MQYFSSRKFDKQFSKLPGKIKEQCIERMKIFTENPYSEILNNHQLSGSYIKFRSIDITGDIRAIYEVIQNNIAHFVAVGSHSELYK